LRDAGDGVRQARRHRQPALQVRRGSARRRSRGCDYGGGPESIRSPRQGARRAAAAGDRRPVLRVPDQAARVPGPLPRRIPARRRHARGDDPARRAAHAAPLPLMRRGGETRLLSLLRPYSPLFAATIGATVVSSVLDGFTFVLLIPFLRTLFGTAALPADGGTKAEAVLNKIAGPFLQAGTPAIALRNVVIVLLVALLLKNLTSYLSSIGSVSIQEGVVRDLRIRLFRHLQTLPLAYFQRTRAGQTIARVISDTDQVKTAVSAALASLLQNVVVILVYVAILFGLSVKLTLLSLLLAPVLLLIIRPMINRLRRRSRELAAERGEVTSHVGEMIASAKLVRAYVAEAFELGRFGKLAERYRRRVLRAQRYSSLTSPVSEVFGGVMIVLILVVGTRLALGAGASLDPAVLITFLAVSLRLMSPIKSVSNYPAIMATAVASAERVFEVLDLPSAEFDRPGETTAEFSERIEYRGVSFEYEAAEAVLRDVELDVKRGQVVAIVGPSGAGK